MIAMPGIVWLLASEYPARSAASSSCRSRSAGSPSPTSCFISLVAMLSGLLNARSRFGPGAFAPVLLNIFLISGILTRLLSARRQRRRYDRRLLRWP